MLDQYVKLFNTSWIEPWMVEALGIIFGALLVGYIVIKAVTGFNGDEQ